MILYHKFKRRYYSIVLKNMHYFFTRGRIIFVLRDGQVYDILPLLGDERLKTMTVAMAAAACGGKLVGCDRPDAPLSRAIIDSRAVLPGDLFVAYRGERTDGHRFIPMALEKGAACCLAEELPENITGPVLLVDDVQRALEQITAAYRKTLSLPVVGITGSVGKTTAKEMVSAVLAQHYRVLKTEGNLNNQIGVPMTVSRIEAGHEVAVVEMGISGFGEMTALAKIAQPTVALFTVIGRAHLEFLHDLDGVFRAKTEMLDQMPEGSPVIYNGDDAQLRRLSDRPGALSYGLGEDCAVRADEVELLAEGRTRCWIRYGDRTIRAEVPAFGKQLVYAALEGAAVGFVLGLSDEEITRGIAAYAPVSRRGDLYETDFVTLMDDSYNANPESMRCAIDSLIQLPGRHVAVLADMLEMGPDSEQMHVELGRYARERGVEKLLCCGGFRDAIARGAGEIAAVYADAQAIIDALPEVLMKGDAVLVKASRGMHLETVAEAIKTMGEG